MFMANVHVDEYSVTRVPLGGNNERLARVQFLNK